MHVLPNDDDVLLTRKEAAFYTGFKYQTLATYQWRGRGPKITFDNGKPRYRVGDLKEWLESRDSHMTIQHLEAQIVDLEDIILRMSRGEYPNIAGIIGRAMMRNVA